MIRRPGLMACLGHNGLVHKSVAVIVHAFLQGHIHAVVLAAHMPNVVQCTRAGEEVSILVEADRHHPVCL